MPNQLDPIHTPTSRRSILILSSHLRLGPYGLADVSKCLSKALWRSVCFLSWSGNSPHFVEPKSSSPYSQQPRHLPLSWARLIQSTISTPLFVRFTHFNIILPPTPSSSIWSLSFTFPRQTMHALLLSHIRDTWHCPNTFVTHDTLSQHILEASPYVLFSITPSCIWYPSTFLITLYLCDSLCERPSFTPM